MDNKELFEKYHKLLAENKTLKEENKALKARFGLNGKSKSDQDQGNASNFPLELVAQESPCEIHYQNRIEQGVATPVLYLPIPQRRSACLRRCLKVAMMCMLKDGRAMMAGLAMRLFA